MNKVELLAPAGSLSKLKTAFIYGADAVYIGGYNYSLRANATNFSNQDIKEACNFAHNLNKKIYVTVNIVFHNNNLEGLVTYLKELASYKVDAIIVSDAFIIDLVKDNNIDLKIHISTQASTLNYESALFYKNLGVERVVLAREASRKDIQLIKETGIQVETFIHGAMCASLSGRCVLSNYFTLRDANRGGCSQICRWEFNMFNKDKKEIKSDTLFTMSTKDLSMIKNIPSLIEDNIDSLKVEGRMRSDYYIATVINTYRNAIDDYYSNKLTNDKIDYYSKVLNKVANRDSTSQFYNKFPGVNEQYFLGRQEVSNQDFLGIILDYCEDTKIVTLTQRNYFKPGDSVELFGPNIKPFSFIIPDIYDEEGNSLDAARHPKEIIKFKLNHKVYKNNILRIKI